MNHLRLLLTEHYLAGIDCDHEAKTDRARCACSMVALPVCPTVGAAVQSWIDHVLDEQRRAAAQPLDPEKWVDLFLTEMGSPVASDMNTLKSAGMRAWLAHAYREGSRCSAAATPVGSNELLERRVRELEDAIGVMAPTICRAYIQSTTYEPEREWTWKVLKRLNDAMGRKTEPLSDLPWMADPRGAAAKTPARAKGAK